MPSYTTATHSNTLTVSATSNTLAHNNQTNSGTVTLIHTNQTDKQTRTLTVPQPALPPRSRAH